MQVASDEGMKPVTGKATKKANDVGGLIAAVESKMAELMSWHAQQVRQLETDKLVLETQVQQQKDTLREKATELDAERDLLTERMQQVDQQRVKLVELTSKLRAEESALSREWAEVHRDREALQQQAADLAAQRVRIDDRAKNWLENIAKELSTPLKLTGSSDDRQAA